MSTTASPSKKPLIDNRHLVRQLLIQRLYASDFGERGDRQLELIEPDLLEHLELEYLNRKLEKRLEKSGDEITAKLEAIRSERAKLDEMVEKYAPAWPLAQINPVDLQILRLAIYEGFISKELPAKVAIDEGIELARDFGTETNVKFVSGVLGTLYNDLRE